LTESLENANQGLPEETGNRRQIMKTLFEIPTRGDTMTMPGGMALCYREETGEFIVHNFNTDRDTGKTREYFGGGYYCSGTPAERLSAAMADLSKRAERASGYTTGGSIDMEKLLGLPAQIPA
jgi:hypothetical protein